MKCLSQLLQSITREMTCPWIKRALAVEAGFWSISSSRAEALSITVVMRNDSFLSDAKYFRIYRLAHDISYRTWYVEEQKHSALELSKAVDLIDPLALPPKCHDVLFTLDRLQSAYLVVPRSTTMSASEVI
jgi:hypothetical protein